MADEAKRHAADELADLRERVARLEAERATAEARFRRLAETSDTGTVLLDGGVVVHANEQACQLLGRSLEQLRDTPLRNLLGLEDRNRFAAAVEQAIGRGPGPAVLEATVLPTQGEPRRLRFRFQACDLRKDRDDCLLTVCDANEAQSAHEALEERERFLADIFASIQDGISVLDANLRIVRTNAAMERWYDHAMPLVGKRCFEAYHRRTEACDLCPTSKTLATKRAAVETVPKRDGNGAIVGWLDLHTFPLWDRRTGQLGGVIEYVRDVSERRRAEAERDRLFAYSMDMLCVARFDGHFEQVNPACTQTLGWSEEEMKAISWLNLVHPDDVVDTRAMLESLRSGDPVRGFLGRIRCRDESYRWISWNVFPQALDELVYCVGRDVTARRRLEEELRQAHKMEAVGRLAAGVAHDFNNLLTPIIGYTDLALMSVGPGDRWHEELHQILAAANHAQALTQQLLAFGRKQVLQVRSVDLSTCTRDTAPLLRRLISESIEIDLQLDPAAGAVRADPGQLAQIVINLAINGAESMPDGGRLTLETAAAQLDESDRRSHVGVEPGEYCLLRVSDTGGGMDEQTAQRVFEPFFTTKDRSTGTGLGLAVVHGIVKQHGGHIWLRSSPGTGASFEVYLPKAVSRPPARPSRPAPNAPRGLGETVLVVEDSPAVRRLAVMALENVGYQVLAAGSAEEAIALVRSTDGPVDLLLTDVVLPGLNGRRLHEKLAAEQHGLRVVYMSGYTDNVIARHGILDEQTLLLQKPFAIDQLVRIVQRGLAREAPTPTANDGPEDSDRSAGS